MGRFLNPDNRTFEDALNSEIYIDKTSLLEYTNKVMNTTSKFICSSRPRRFGKSMTADMLTAYYSKGCDSLDMFRNLKIGNVADFEKNLNRYDVIHFDIQWCMTASGGAENVISYITQNVIKELKQQYSEVYLESDISVAEALSLINTQTGNRFVIIIDEWDVLIRDEARNTSVQEKYIYFLRSLFKGAEPSRYIALAYLTGILPIKKIKTQSALNNFDEFTMLDCGPLAEFVGFTDEDVRKLCEQYSIEYSKVKIWYDGYILGAYQVYNPKAVVNVMTRRDFVSYWSQTGTYEAIVPLINMDFGGLKAAIIEMISGAQVKVDVTSFQNDTINFTNRDDVITYLIHLGYLGYNKTFQTAFIPNEEIRLELINATKRKKWDELIKFKNESDRLLEATLDMNEEAVAIGIEKLHNDYASTISYNNENSLSSVLTIAYLSSLQFYFKPIREMPTGRGFADFVYIPKYEYQEDYPALVVELKWNKSARTAVEQVKDRKYPQSLSDYIGNILIVGINYDKKTKEHSCTIEEYVID